MARITSRVHIRAETETPPDRTSRRALLKMETAGSRGAKFAVPVRRCGRDRWPGCGRVDLDAHLPVAVSGRARLGASDGPASSAARRAAPPDAGGRARQRMHVVAVHDTVGGDAIFLLGEHQLRDQPARRFRQRRHDNRADPIGDRITRQQQDRTIPTPRRRKRALEAGRAGPSSSGPYSRSTEVGADVDEEGEDDEEPLSAPVVPAGSPRTHPPRAARPCITPFG